jgi:hypothetical protein
VTESERPPTPPPPPDDAGTDAATSAEPEPRRVRRWTLVLFRAAITLEALLVLGQPVLAGDYLSGRYDALRLHEANAMATAGVAVLQLVAAVLLRRPGGGPRWPIGGATALVAGEAGEIVLGFHRVLAVHVPLGVLLVTGVALQLARAWTPRTGLRRTAERARTAPQAPDTHAPDTHAPAALGTPGATA